MSESDEGVCPMCRTAIVGRGRHDCPAVRWPAHAERVAVGDGSCTRVTLGIDGLGNSGASDGCTRADMVYYAQRVADEAIAGVSKDDAGYTAEQHGPEWWACYAAAYAAYPMLHLLRHSIPR